MPLIVEGIVWDIDLKPGEEYKDVRAKLNLPERVEIPWLQFDKEEDKNIFEVNTEIWDDVTDWLIKQYGYGLVTYCF